MACGHSDPYGGDDTKAIKEETNMESFGSRLAQLRKSRNMTQEDLAECLNISAQAVSKWENDLTSPDLETLLKLAEIFGVSTDELLGRIKTEAHLAEIHEKKDINQMLLHIDVDSADGDRVRINLPMAIIKVLVESGAAMNFLGGKASLENIDWKQIMNLVEQGVVGELISVQSADGDIVSIRVE